MADPLSVGSGLVTLISTCTAIGKHTVSFIEALRDAPLELVFLSNELNDLNAILNEVSHVFSTKAHEQTIPSTTQQNVLA